MEFKRARSEQQKGIRLAQIANSALELYKEQPYDEITLSSIAEKLDFSRANLYKYFSSKEEIFLMILGTDIKEWGEDVANTMSGFETLTRQEFAHHWAEILFRHKRLIELFSIMNTVIEKHVSVERLAVFKKDMFSNFSMFFEMLQKLLPEMSEEKLRAFLQLQLNYAMGLFPTTIQNEIQKEAIRISGIPFEIEEFVPAFEKFLVVVLLGLEII
ncbi:MAG: TetR/AcrR family transcriptional regulator [Clostridiales bacterium]|nr:TetR/AcrR family transcriptional regulator [Clostridiales bacterium]